MYKGEMFWTDKPLPSDFSPVPPDGNRWSRKNHITPNSKRERRAEHAMAVRVKA
jgi:hypothetical protein